MSGDATGRWTESGAGIWILIGGAVCAAMAPLEPNLLEEGLMLHVGERMLKGHHLYGDILLVTGPVPYALTALLFAVFGESVLVARAGVVALQALASGAVFAMARRAGVGPWAHAAAACFASGPVFFFPLLSTMFYTTIATSLAIVSAYLGLRAIRSAPWAVAAGVSVALTALSKQTVGAVLAVALVATVAALAAPGLRIRRAAEVSAGGALTALCTLVVFGALGDLGDFVSSMVARPEGETFSFPFINLWPPGHLTPSQFRDQFYYLPETAFLLREAKPFPKEDLSVAVPYVLATQVLYLLPGFAIAATGIRRLFGPLRDGAWLHAVALIAVTVNLFPRSDAGHLVFVAPMALAHLFVLAPTVHTATWLPALRAATAAVTLAIALGCWGVGSRLYALSHEPSYGPRVPLRTISPPKSGPAVPRVLNWLVGRITPGEAIFVARAEPLVYFATRTRNPTRFTGALQVWGVRKEQEEEILEALEEVRFVVMSDVDEPIYTFFRDELPAVQAHLERHYHMPAAFSGHRREDDWLVVLERGADRGEAAVDLFDASGTAEAWLRGPDGKQRPAPPPATTLPTRHNRRPLAIALGARGGGLDFRVVVPPGGRFQSDVGFRRIEGWKQPSRLVFAVSVSDGGPFETVAEQPVRFKRGRIARTWRPLEADLARWAGRTITLRLEAKSARRLKPGSFALWASPRVALPPPG
jgi:hypothetical protein